MQIGKMDMKIVFCGYEIKTSVTRATRKPGSLVNKGFFGVAVPKKTATHTATHCYPNFQGKETMPMIAL